MRINPEQVNSGTEPLQRQGVDSAAKASHSPASAEAGKQIGGHANVSISGKAQDIDRLVKVAVAGPEAGDERVEELRGQIQNGTYKVDFEKLADSFLSRNPFTDSF